MKGSSIRAELIELERFLAAMKSIEDEGTSVGEVERLEWLEVVMVAGEELTLALLLVPPMLLLVPPMLLLAF